MNAKVHKVKEWINKHKQQFEPYMKSQYMRRLKDNAMFKLKDCVILKSEEGQSASAHIVGFHTDMIHVAVLVDGILPINKQINNIELDVFLNMTATLKKL